MATEYDVLRSMLARAERDDDRIARGADKNSKRKKLLALLNFLRSFQREQPGTEQPHRS